MSKVLLFFTSSYPFGSGETFIENEIEYLAKAFDKMVIVSNDISNVQTRQVPDNVVLMRKDYELKPLHKLSSFNSLFYKEFWTEYKIVKTIYRLKLTATVFNTMLQSWLKAILWQAFIRKIIKHNSEPNDALFLYSYWNNDMALAIARYKQKHSNIKAFTRMHRWDIYFEENQINYLPYRKYIFKNLDRIFSISINGIKYTKETLKNPDLNIVLSRLGVKSNELLTRKPNDVLTILTLSNLIPIKNIEVLINGLALTKIPFNWVHIGNGPLKANLERLAQHLFPKKHNFIGALSNAEVMAYIKSNPVDVFVNVSLSEGIPVSIMEAISFGIPCIATSVGGTPEIVNNENGILLGQNPKPDEIAQALERFYWLTLDEKEQKRQAAYQTWNTKYNAEKNYSEFVKTILAL